MEAMREPVEYKSAIERVIEKDLKEILEGGSECVEVLSLLKKLKFDESLLIALPSTCAKAHSDRGSFDSMVLTQLETSLRARLEEVCKEIEAAAPAAQEHAAAVDAAQEALVKAQASQTFASDEQAVAVLSQQDASGAVDAA